LRRRISQIVALALLAALVGGCAAGRSYRKGFNAGQVGDWDAAVEYYKRAVQSDPDKAEYRIALERAMQNASRIHMDRARDLESKDQLDGALGEYKRVAEYDPTNRQAAARAVELEKMIRDRIEAARPRPAIEQLREQARQAAPEPVLNPASREPLRIQFNNASLRDILNFIGNATGINVTYDRDFQDRPYSVQLDGVTLEQALSQILTANGLFFKVLNERTIIIVPDTPQKRAAYEEQVIRTFYISHADVQELSQLISSVIRVPQMAVQPMVAVNKTANTITVRATASVAAVIERIIDSNDKPRAEIVIDVEILEVNRTRAQQYGLKLTDYAIGTIFSPEVPPPNTSTAPSGVASPPPFNLNTITRGVSMADFYTAVPAAFVRFLETDSQTKLIAKPQLRGAEGQKLTLNLGDEVPVPSTTFQPIAAGGAAASPLTSFNYRPVGVNIEMTPRVTYEGEIVLDLLVESSSIGDDRNIAGQNLPSFGSRKVTTRLRLRDGESNLLAGLLREDERRLLRGFPGIARLPVLRHLLSDNDTSIASTDIVMLLTPRIIRSHELTAQDLTPIYIGTQQNIGISGPAPLIAPVGGGAAPAGAAPGGTGTAPAGTQPPAAGAPAAPVVQPPPAARPGLPQPSTGARPGVPGPPAGTQPGVPGATAQPGAAPGTVPAPAAPETPGAPPAPPPQDQPAAQPPAPAAPPVPQPGAASILVTPPGTEFRVSGGPYTVPISISGASQVSTISITLQYNPAALRVRSVQEGSFMRQGGIAVSFTQQVDPAGGRVDIAIARNADSTGASGSGLLAAVLFDAIAEGSATFSSSGAAVTPSGDQVPLQFSPVTVTVR
jgi:type II secretory pathway component GspD/PulD (secretin)